MIIFITDTDKNLSLIRDVERHLDWQEKLSFYMDLDIDSVINNCMSASPENPRNS